MRLVAYNWEQPDWPNFRYDLSGLHDSLLLLAERTGLASGCLQGLTPDAQIEATVMIMVADALKTSAFEGELLSRRDVLSSIRKNLGLETGSSSGDTRAQGAAALMLAVRNTIETLVTEEVLFFLASHGDDGTPACGHWTMAGRRGANASRVGSIRA